MVRVLVVVSGAECDIHIALLKAFWDAECEELSLLEETGAASRSARPTCGLSERRWGAGPDRSCGVSADTRMRTAGGAGIEARVES